MYVIYRLQCPFNCFYEGQTKRRLQDYGITKMQFLQETKIILLQCMHYASFHDSNPSTLKIIGTFWLMFYEYCEFTHTTLFTTAASESLCLAALSGSWCVSITLLHKNVYHFIIVDKKKKNGKMMAFKFTHVMRLKSNLFLLR